MCFYSESIIQLQTCLHREAVATVQKRFCRFFFSQNLQNPLDNLLQGMILFTCRWAIQPEGQEREMTKELDEKEARKEALKARSEAMQKKETELNAGRT